MRDNHAMTGRRRWVGGTRGVLLAIALAITVAGCGTSEPTDPAVVAAAGGDPYADVTQTVRLQFAGGAAAGGTQRVPVALGKVVTVVVSSDVAGEIHLHGYDKSAAVPSGGVGTVVFSADSPGIYDVEMHGADVVLAQLAVS